MYSDIVDHQVNVKCVKNMSRQDQTIKEHVDFTASSGKSGDVDHEDVKMTKEEDRFALYTDGETCWNPPISLYESARHPIPNMEPPNQEFRQCLQDILRSSVKEWLVSEALYIVSTRFEQQCIKVGVKEDDINLFRSTKYDNQVIIQTLFGKWKIKQKPDAETRIVPKSDLPPLNLKDLVLWKIAEDNSIYSSDLEGLLEHPDIKINWDFVSKQLRNVGYRSVSPAACERLWNNALSPMILQPHQWTRQDFLKLKTLVYKQRKRNFVKIAEQMGKRIHPYVCMKLFTTYIKPSLEKRYDDKIFLRDLFNKPEVKKEFREAMQFFNYSLRSVAAWLNHIYGAEFPTHLIREFTDSHACRIGPFSCTEDAILLVTEEICRVLKFEGNPYEYNYQDFLPWRTSASWRNRLFAIKYPHRVAAGNQNDWSKKEDIMLLKLAKKYQGNWNLVKSHFMNPARNRKQVFSRYLMLGHKLRKQTLDEYHTSRQNKLRMPFYFLRKCLFMLDEVASQKRCTKCTRCKEVHASDMEESPPEVIKTTYQNFMKHCREKVGKPHRGIVVKYPEDSELRSFLFQISNFYIERAANRIRTFLTEIGIEQTQM